MHMSAGKHVTRNFLPRHQKWDFGRDGFVVLKGLVANNELSTLRTHVELTLRLPHESSCARPHNTLVPLRWTYAIVQMMLGSTRRVQQLGDALDAKDLRWISGYISIKEARSPALWWHQDWWCWEHPVSFRRATSQTAVLCYLADTSSHNGALRVLPGSHHKSAPIHASLPDAHGHDAEGLESGNIAMNDLPGQVTLSLKAGDAVAMDYRLLHGTHGNASGDRRDCIVLNFTPCWKDLPDEVKAHLIQHPAQPSQDEVRQRIAMTSRLLPTFDGIRSSLPLNRNAPPEFQARE